MVEVTDMHNERFNKYYKGQNILPDAEWDQFLASLREVLPTTFRVAGSRQCVTCLQDVLTEPICYSGLHACSMTRSKTRMSRILQELYSKVMPLRRQPKYLGAYVPLQSAN